MKNLLSKSNKQSDKSFNKFKKEILSIAILSLAFLQFHDNIQSQ